MIVASLLLVSGAVVLLVLGLAGGSSELLIGSIVASLLAAVALVIGARQSAGARAAAGAGGPEDRRFAPADRSAAGPAGQRDAGGVAGHGGPPEPAPSVVRETSAPAGSGRVGEPVVLSAGLAGDDPSVPAGGSAAPSADVEPAMAAAAQPAMAAAAEPAMDARVEHERSTAQSADPVSDPAVAARAAGQRDAREWLADDGDRAAAAAGEGAGEADPAGEPAVQRVSAMDAARVARLTSEVLVVDGRPRYHLAGCPHLTGKAAEGLPAAEAVELGFSPCALCRPVDRLLLTVRRG